MDVTKLLEADHRETEDLFDKIDKAKGAKRQPLIDQLDKALRSHMELEEKILYPAAEPVLGHEASVEANVEHDLARKGLDEMLRLAPDEPGFGAALASVKAGIDHHVKEEEDEVFPKLRKNGAPVLKRITTPFMQTRAESGLPTGADALEASSTKDELLADARSAGIEKTSGMSKHDLATALAGKIS